MKITIPEVRDRFAEYYRATERQSHPAYGEWGSLHIVLADRNVADSDVLFCIEFAGAKGDTEGQELAKILLSMSKTQRIKLGRTVL